MATYNPEGFSSQFRGSVQSTGMNAERAYDRSRQIEQNYKRKNENLENERRVYQLGAKLDNATFEKNQKDTDADYALAKKKQATKWKIYDAETSAQNSMVKGILSLSGTALKAYEQIDTYQKEETKKREEQDAALGFIFDGAGATVLDDQGAASSSDPTTFGIVAGDQNQDALEVAGEQAIGGVAADEPYVQEELRVDQADQRMVRRNVQMNVHSASTGFLPELQTFMQSTAQVQLADGRVITPAGARTQSELNEVLMAGASYIARNQGVSGMDAAEVVRHYMPTVKASINAMQQQWGGRILTANQNNRLQTAADYASSALSTGQTSYSDIWTKLSGDYFVSGKYNGDRTKSNEAALKDLIGMVGNDPVALEELKNVPKFYLPNGKPGPPLYSGTNKAIFDKAIRTATSNNIADARNQKYQQQEQVTELKATWLQAMVDADGDPEAVRNANESYEASLLENGTPEALEAYQAAANQSDALNPLAGSQILEAIANGEDVTAQINQAEAAGAITPAQATSYRAQSPDANDPRIKAQDAVFKSLAKEEIIQALSASGKASAGIINPNTNSFDAQYKGQLDLIQQDVVARSKMHMARWLKENPDATPGQVRAEMNRFSQQELPKLLKNIDIPEVGDQPGSRVTGYSFSTPQPAISAPTFVNQKTGRRGRVLTQMTTNEIRTAKESAMVVDDVYPNDDRLLTKKEFTEGVQAFANGNTKQVPARVRAMADALGMSTADLLTAQANAQGIDLDLSKLQEEQASSAQVSIDGTATPQQLMNAFETMNFSERGAAYLAGSVFQESTGNPAAYNPDDLGAPSGGLVQWRGPRLDAIQNYYGGRDITKITAQEQMKYMVMEMERDYPEAYRIFRNQNATDSQLRRAVFQYWGYGEVGKRYTYANQLLGGRPVQRQALPQRVGRDLSAQGSSNNSRGQAGTVSSVPYINQRTSVSGQGDRECFSAVSTMLANALGQNVSFSQYNGIRGGYGDSTLPASQTQALAQLGINASVADNGSIQEVAQIASSGTPVPVGIMPYGGSGHWILITGVTPNGDFRVHDPYGQLVQSRGGGWAYRNGTSAGGQNAGRDVIYSRSFLASVFEDRGAGTGRIMRVG